MLPGYAAYVATKGAVEQFSHVLAKELGPRNITVNDTFSFCYFRSGQFVP